MKQNTIVSLEADDLQRVREIAKIENRSLNAQLRTFCEKGILNYDHTQAIKEDQIREVANEVRQAEQDEGATRWATE